MKRHGAGRGRRLSEEDRVLWHRVASTTRPLHGSASVHAIVADGGDRAGTPPSVDVKKAAEQLVRKNANPADQPPSPRPVLPQHPIDRAQKRKLAKGRLPIEARIDLHGLYQAQAHDQLLAFLSAASRRGLRHVLVITGKGSSPESQGVLARMVPQWFRTAPFRAIVSGHESAARHHGGGGALYVRLRRQGGSESG